MNKAHILFFVMLISVSFNSQAFSVSNFIQKCSTAHQSKPDETPQQTVNRALDAGSCGGFVGGVISGVNLVGNILIKQNVMPNNFICLPPKKQVNELLVEVLKYMNNTPELHGAPAQLGVYNALATTYTCAKPKK